MNEVLFLNDIILEQVCERTGRAADYLQAYGIDDHTIRIELVEKLNGICEAYAGNNFSIHIWNRADLIEEAAQTTESIYSMNDSAQTQYLLDIQGNDGMYMTENNEWFIEVNCG